jgi:osmoprotectant transport system ATP-binding protein
VIRLDAVTKRWPDGHVAVNELTLEVSDGEVCVLLGPSGCGKTTTMKMINRLVEPTSGRIEIDGVDVQSIDAVELRRGIGYVIQQVGLFPHQTVAANIGTVPKLLGWDKQRIASRVDELLTLVGLEPSSFRPRYPHQLSGGQRQRVGVARALGADPPVLLMDEPFGAIDPVNRARLQDEFLRLQALLRKTVVFVTHDLDEAVKLGDRIAVLNDGGVLAQVAPPAELLAEPADAFVAGFVGAGRGLRRLRVTAIARRDVVDAGALDVRSLRRVPLGASLEDALAALLLDDAPAVAVTDGDVVLGVLTPDGLHAAARRAHE